MKGKRKNLKKGYRTRSGFYLRLNILPPYIFHELEAMYDVYRSEFTEKKFVEETGATLEYPYSPPDPPPKEGDERWQVYVEYLNYMESFTSSVEKYTIERSKLALLLGCDVISHSKRGFSWEDEMLRGEWIEKLAAVKITVTDKNRKLLYLKTVVLSDGQDYLNVINKIIVEEVKMSDVIRALDYFLGILDELPSVKDNYSIARIRGRVINEILGGQDGSDRGDEVK